VAVTLETVAGALRGGAGLVEALRTASTADAGGSFAAGVGRIVADVDAGSALDAAFRRWAGREATQWATASADVAAVASEMGAGLPQALERLARAARSEADLLVELRVLAAPARASALVMSAMPLVFGLLVVLPEAQMRQFLTTPAGASCCGLALVLQCAGYAWMRSIVGSFR
jgi:Flp pilus assembly protein TadB